MACLRTYAWCGAFTAVVGGLAFAAPGCTDLLEVDGHLGVADELCKMIEQCYGPDLYPDCHARVSERLEAADPATRSQYLESFANAFCLESCSNARACLDGAPLCDAAGQACGGIETCCGFAVGASECKGGACCVPVGGACDDSTPCCAGECRDGTCGGVTCKTQGQACSAEGECCGELRCDLADDKTCQSCEPLMGPCAGDLDCCDGICDLAAGVCVAGMCTQVGGDCKHDGDCCGDLVCVQAGLADHEICSTGQCLPDLVACGEDLPPCCTSECESGLCGGTCKGLGQSCNATTPCCQEFGCRDNACCLLPGQPCLEGSDCCSGKCDGTHCALPQNCIDSGSCVEGSDCCSGDCTAIVTATQETLGCCVPIQACGTPCAVHAAPLHPSCTWGNQSLSNTATACVTAVCAQNPECCCSAWTPECVQLVKDLPACDSLACPTTSP